MGKTNYGFYLIGGGLAFVVGALSWIFVFAPEDDYKSVYTGRPDVQMLSGEDVSVRSDSTSIGSRSTSSSSSSSNIIGRESIGSTGSFKGGSRHYRKSRKGRKSHNKKSKKRSKV
jgi:hypothetical protein